MNRLQRTLREMLLIGIAIAILLRLTGRNVNDAAGIFACIFTGLLFSPIAWGIYRLARFVILPRH